MRGAAVVKIIRKQAAAILIMGGKGANSLLCIPTGVSMKALGKGHWLFFACCQTS